MRGMSGYTATTACQRLCASGWQTDASISVRPACKSTLKAWRGSSVSNDPPSPSISRQSKSSNENLMGWATNKHGAATMSQSHNQAVTAAIALLAETFPKCFSVYEGRRRPLRLVRRCRTGFSFLSRCKAIHNLKVPYDFGGVDSSNKLQCTSCFQKR